MKKIWVHKTNSLKKANAFEKQYYLSKSAQGRLSDIQLCREHYFKMKGILNEDRKRLRRVIKIIQQAPS